MNDYDEYEDLEDLTPAEEAELRCLDKREKKEGLLLVYDKA